MEEQLDGTLKNNEFKDILKKIALNLFIFISTITPRPLRDYLDRKIRIRFHNKFYAHCKNFCLWRGVWNKDYTFCEYANSQYYIAYDKRDSSITIKHFENLLDPAETIFRKKANEQLGDYTNPKVYKLLSMVSYPDIGTDYYTRMIQDLPNCQEKLDAIPQSERLA